MQRGMLRGTNQEEGELLPKGAPQEPYVCDLFGEEEPKPDPYLKWSQVFEEEQHDIKTKFEQTHGAGSDAIPFTLAFSGGGVRAAAFQAGVLWKLAELGKLKDVDYLTAVSGGGYIASAYASQIVNNGSPPSRPDGRPPSAAAVDNWYKKVVADTLVRMQANAGNFVRDCTAGRLPDGTWERSGFFGFGHCPRWCDCLILVVVLIITFCVNPVTFVALLLIPTVEFVELFFGAAMRAALCTFNEAELADNLAYYSFFRWLEWTVLGLLVCSLLASLSASLCPMLQAGEQDEETGFKKVTPAYFVTYGIRKFLTRAAGLLTSLTLLIASAVLLERMKFCIAEALHLKSGEESWLVARCNAWVGTAEHPGTHAEHGDCSAIGTSPWYKEERFMNQTYDGHICDAEWLQTPGMLFDVIRFILLSFGEDLLGALTVLIFATFCFAVLLLPAIPGVMSRCIALCGPFLIFAFLLEFTQWRVYGAMLHDRLFGVVTFRQHNWATAVAVASILAATLIVVYSELRAIQHIYYRRCLQNNFLAEGRDIKLKELANPWCPLVLLTGIVSDFVRPGDTSEHQTISEISLTQLHAGSIKTGFTRTPEYQTLGKVMALSGAGCLDAISLSLNHQGRMRFWTEALNLTWGDYVLFHDKSQECTKRKARWLGGRWEGEFLWLFRLMPAMLLMVGSYVLICIAAIMSTQGEEPNSRCVLMKFLWTVALSILALCIAGSFFAVCFKPTAFSPILRGLHQLTSFHHTGNHAPPLLYVTDGGAVDCVTLMQLVMRKCKRILLVLANADPHDDLSVVKVAVNRVLDMKLASFFDPNDPCNDINTLFDRFKHSADMPYLRIGIVYGWKDGRDNDANRKEEYGTLILMKNRLRDCYKGMHVPPLMTSEEIRGMPPAQEDMRMRDERWGKITQEQLGGLCCCDCCHLHCNAGAKFPHLTGANYLYLTPQLFNCLARLGYREAGPAIEALLREPLWRAAM